MDILQDLSKAGSDLVALAEKYWQIAIASVVVFIGYIIYVVFF